MSDIIGQHGKRLLQLREQRYKTDKEAVAAMNECGYAISLDQFKRLLEDEWPTEEQVYMIVDFFEVKPEYFLFGVENRLDKLIPEDRKVIGYLIDRLLELQNLTDLADTTDDGD